MQETHELVIPPFPGMEADDSAVASDTEKGVTISTPLTADKAAAVAQMQAVLHQLDSRSPESHLQQAGVSQDMFAHAPSETRAPMHENATMFAPHHETMTAHAPAAESEHPQELPEEVHMPARPELIMQASAKKEVVASTGQPRAARIFRAITTLGIGPMLDLFKKDKGVAGPRKRTAFGEAFANVTTLGLRPLIHKARGIDSSIK